MHIIFYCPAEIKEIKEISIPLGEAFLPFLPFLRDLKHAGWLDLFYYPAVVKKNSSLGACIKQAARHACEGVGLPNKKD